MAIHIVDETTQKVYAVNSADPTMLLDEDVSTKRWLGQTEAGEPAIITIPHAGVREGQLAHLWHELALVQKLRDTPVQQHLPWMNQGHIRDDSTAVIVTEYISPDWSLSKQIQAATDPASEALGLAAAEQYINVLTQLHQLGHLAHKEQQLQDFYWDAQQQRLVVTNWSQAETILSDGQPDIQVFAGLWIQLLSQLDYVPLDIEHIIGDWQQLSRGTRQILNRAYYCHTPWGYHHLELLQADLTRHHQDYRAVLSYPEHLLADAYLLSNKAENSSDLHTQISVTDQILNILDLLGRSPIEPNRTQELQTWVTQQAVHPDIRIVQILDNARTTFRRGQYEQALSLITEALNLPNFQGESLKAYQTKLRLKRWQTVAQAAVIGVENLIVMEESVQHLLACIDQLDSLVELDEEAKTKVAEQFEAVWESLGSPIHASLEPLRLDVAIQTLQGSSVSDCQEAIQNILNKFPIDEQIYVDSLRAQYPVLSQQQIDHEERRLHEARMITQQQAFDSALDDVMHRLQQTEQTWPLLSEVLVAVREAYFAARLSSDERGLPTRQAAYALADWVNDINNQVVAGRLAEALVQLNRPVDSSYNEALKVKVVILIQTLALQQVDNRVKNRGWPADLDNAYKILAALSETNQQFPEQAIEEATIQHLQNGLDNWAQQLHTYQTQLGSFLQNPLHLIDTNDPNIDEILTRAIDAHIELFEQTGPDGNVGKMPVAYLLQTRQLKQLVARIQTFKADLLHNIEAIDVTSLDAVNLTTLIASTSQFQADLKVLQADLASIEQTIHRVNKLDEQREQAEHVIEQWSELSVRFQKIEQMADTLNVDLQATAHRVREHVVSAEVVQNTSYEHIQVLQSIETDLKNYLDSLSQLQTDSEDKLVHHVLVAGLNAARRFDLPTAQSFLSSVERFYAYLNGPMVELLRQAVTWMQHHDVALSDFQEWRNATLAGHLEHADKAYQRIQSWHTKHKALDNWMIQEILSAYNTRRQIAATSEPIPSNDQVQALVRQWQTFQSQMRGYNHQAYLAKLTPLLYRTQQLLAQLLPISQQDRNKLQQILVGTFQIMGPGISHASYERVKAFAHLGLLTAHLTADDSQPPQTGDLEGQLKQISQQLIQPFDPRRTKLDRQFMALVVYPVVQVNELAHTIAVYWSFAQMTQALNHNPLTASQVLERLQHLPHLTIAEQEQVRHWQAMIEWHKQTDRWEKSWTKTAESFGSKAWSTQTAISMLRNLERLLNTSMQETIVRERKKHLIGVLDDLLRAIIRDRNPKVIVRDKHLLELYAIVIGLRTKDLPMESFVQARQVSSADIKQVLSFLKKSSPKIPFNSVLTVYMQKNQGLPSELAHRLVNQQPKLSIVFWLIVGCSIYIMFLTALLISLSF